MEKIKNLFKKEKISNDISHIQTIEILLRLFCFQKEIKEKMNTFQEINEDNKLKSGFFVDKSFIQKYKKFFEYENFVQSFKNSKALNKLKDSNGNINYDKIDEKNNSSKAIIEAFMKDNSNFVKNIIEKNKKVRNYKELIDKPCPILYEEKGKIKLYYIDKFEFISEQAYLLMQKQLSFNNFAYLCRYIIEKKYFFFCILIGSNKIPMIVEIGKFINDNRDFKVEYVIKFNKNGPQEFLKYLDKEGISDLINYFNNNIDKETNEYKFNGETIKYYQINKFHNNNNINENKNNLPIFKENENLCKISLLCFYYSILKKFILIIKI